MPADGIALEEASQLVNVLRFEAYGNVLAEHTSAGQGVVGALRPQFVQARGGRLYMYFINPPRR